MCPAPHCTVMLTKLAVSLPWQGSGLGVGPEKLSRGASSGKQEAGGRPFQEAGMQGPRGKGDAGGAGLEEQRGSVLAAHCEERACQVTSVVSDSVRPHRRQPTRLPRSWDSPGKNTGVGCHFLLQCIKVKRESEVAQSCLTLHDPMDCSLRGSSVHGIFQARVLEWGAIAFSGYIGQ